MKFGFLSLILIFFCRFSVAQTIQSGEYQFGLKLAFDSSSKKLSGYYMDYTGWDEDAKAPRFSCVFYIEGRVLQNTVDVLTYFPKYKSDDLIKGQLEIINNNTLKFKLQAEHGGCWNVQHFADEQVLFHLEKAAKWIQIRYVVADKAYFHSEPSEATRQKAYLVKSDFVCVEKVKGRWSYVTFFGKRITKGWLKIADLNES